MLPNDYICEGQMSVWDCMTDATPLKFDKNKTLRVIELFAGYGSQSMALKRLGVKMEHHKVVEFDKYAVNSFNAVHGTNYPTIDIREITGKDLEYPRSTTRRGRVIDKGMTSPTLTTENIPNVLEEFKWEIDGETYLIRIRKLTPRECGRLMGVSDEDIDKILEVNSNTQAYKQFGNSIVVDVMENIFVEMVPDEWSKYMNPPIED